MAKHETTEDVIAELRDYAVVLRCKSREVDALRKQDVNCKVHPRCNRVADIMRKAQWYDHTADRIEAAHKREMDEMFDALVRIGNWCAQDLAENAYVSDSSGNYLKTLNGLCEVCRPFMRKAIKLKKYGGTNG